MDPNLEILVILGGVAGFVGVVVALIQSQRIRRYGFLGALRRIFSSGAGHSPYGR